MSISRRAASPFPLNFRIFPGGGMARARAANGGAAFRLEKRPRHARVVYRPLSCIRQIRSQTRLE